MASMMSVKQSSPTLTAHNISRSKARASALSSSLLPPLPASKNLNWRAPHLVRGAPAERRRGVRGGASGGDRDPGRRRGAGEAGAAAAAATATAAKAAQRAKIGVYFATWWALNVVFNIYNKKVLNAFPYPWLTSTLSLAAGSLIMLVSWATRIAETPKTDLEFWKALAPYVAVAHTIGHVAATVSMSKVAVSFTHIIKSAEPAFSVVVSRFSWGRLFGAGLPLAHSDHRRLCSRSSDGAQFQHDWIHGAMISNLAFVFRNIFSKKGMKGKSWVAAQSIFYHLYNQVSYMSLDEISPLTFSIGNTMKRISVIVSSIIIFHTPVQPVNALGAAIAILGTFLYSQAKN
uniref:Sugar phosphate transporter domain-containing protein n=1 Tax=Ananas comosus var. bracteatus TaxID=296719 RepID=A0A6V7NKX6_ANACO|nr:unnamed protein product [Ananas comosus var. bracteatus]